MKNISLEDLIKIIACKPDNAMFLVPADIFGHAAKHAAKFSAATILKKYHHHWKIQGLNTTFDIYGIENQDVWMPTAQEWQKKTVVKISMTNEKLAEFAANMNTIND